MGILSSLFNIKQDRFTRDNGRFKVKELLNKNYMIAKNKGHNKPLEATMWMTIFYYLEMIENASNFDEMTQYEFNKQRNEISLEMYLSIEALPFTYIKNNTTAIELYIDYIMYLTFGDEVINKENLGENIRNVYFKEDFPQERANLLIPRWLEFITEEEQEEY